MNPILSVFARPMAMEPRARLALREAMARLKLDATVIADLRGRFAPAPTAEDPGAPIEGTGGTLRIIDSVGVVSVRGPLFSTSNDFDEWLVELFGGTSYNSIWKGLEAALTSQMVRAILLRMNTPGGDADGCGQLARFIYEIRGRKRIEAHVGNMCASAGIWLATQTERITSVAEGESGSIGVRCNLFDVSKFDEMHGFEEIELVSDVSPSKRGTPIDDEVIARLQTRINDLAALFVGAVARGRDCDDAKVLSDFGRGDVMIASKALAAGLIDEIGDFNDTLAALAAAGTTTSSTARAARARTGATAMAIEKKAGDADNEWKCKSCGEMMGPSADKHCSKCATSAKDEDEPDGDEDEEAKALASAGLLGKKKSETRAKLAAFAGSVIEATGAKTAAAAIVAVLASAKAAGELAMFRAQSAAAAAAARIKSVSDKLAAAIASGKVALGVIAKEVALLQGAPKASIRTALAAIGEKGNQDKSAIITAITSAGVSEEFAASVDEWLDSKGVSALPAAHREDSAANPKALDATAPPPVGPDGLPKGADLSIAAIQKAAADKAAAEKKGA